MDLEMDLKIIFNNHFDFLLKNLHAGMIEHDNFFVTNPGLYLFMIIFMLKSRDNFGLVVVGGDLFAVGGSVAIGSQVGRGNGDDSIDDYDHEHDSNDDDFSKEKVWIML